MKRFIVTIKHLCLKRSLKAPAELVQREKSPQIFPDDPWTAKTPCPSENDFMAELPANETYFIIFFPMYLHFAGNYLWEFDL